MPEQAILLMVYSNGVLRIWRFGGDAQNGTCFEMIPLKQLTATFHNQYVDILVILDEVFFSARP